MICRVYGHRGLSGLYPENTLLAFRKALDAGCEGMEFDVHLTRDGEVVIVHDEAIDRTSDRKGLVRDMTYAQLCEADFSYRWAGSVPFQRIPTLREYFSLPGVERIVSNIELKTGVFEYPGIEQAVLDLIREFHMEKNVILSSFNHYSVLRMKALAPELACGFLSETWILDAADYVSSHGIEAYHPQFRMVTDRLAGDMRRKGVAINAWTVNEEPDIREMIRLKADGVISNRPDRVLQVLRESGLR